MPEHTLRKLVPLSFNLLFDHLLLLELLEPPPTLLELPPRLPLLVLLLVPPEPGLPRFVLVLFWELLFAIFFTSLLLLVSSRTSVFIPFIYTNFRDVLQEDLSAPTYPFFRDRGAPQKNIDQS